MNTTVLKNAARRAAGFALKRGRGALAARAGALALTVAVAAGHSAYAQYVPSVEPVHAFAMHGSPKHGPEFEHFDYVNPGAPKGGTIRFGAQGTFDSFHPFIPKGLPASTGSVESLMTSNPEEVFTNYGLIAETIEVPPDRSWAIFNISPNARWHDGRPITAEDVVWSFDTLIEHDPDYARYYSDVEKAELLGDLRVGFVFKGNENRELPLIIGQLPVLPKHYWLERDFTKTTLDPPLGSGPYRVREFEPGRYVVLERVENYWGADLPVNLGSNNFDTMRTDYYRDDTAIRLALKAGKLDFRRENQAKAWAADYEVPAVHKGWLKKELTPHRRPTGMQAFVMNTRRDMFADVRVRKALAYAFDFEWSNHLLFHGFYTRTESYFSNSEFASTGRPQGEEFEVLNQFREQLPAEVFAAGYKPPATDGSGWPRENLKTASALLDEAGWVVRDLKRVNAQTGQPMAFEILLVSQAFERIVLPFARNLAKLGIDARIRLVDRSQYRNRLGTYDFDMIVSGWGQSESPGNEQLYYWSSAAADAPHNRNLAGIKDPVVDELINLLINAPDRESLVARTRALDRVLLAGHYVIPNWHSTKDRILYWDRYARPEFSMKNGETTSRWWYDPAKGLALEQAMDSDTSTVPDTGQLPTRSTAWIAVVAIFAFAAMMWRFRRRRAGAKA